jgi:hypothetical protein
MANEQELTGVALTVYRALTHEFTQTHFRVANVQQNKTGIIQHTLIGSKNGPSAAEVYEVSRPFEMTGAAMTVLCTRS